jgi:hypothetical protein
MLSKFRPRFECLEGRDVPAAFSFQFADGTAGGGSFSAPAGVDPTQARQELAITDLEVTAQNDEFFVRGDAVAIYSYGVLLGVSASVFGDSSNEIRIDPWGAVAYGFANDGSASVAYDAADTQATFTLPDGTAGSISYQTPWNEVNEALASQSLPAIGFNLNVAGKNFTVGSASFTTAPTLQFEYGEFKGVSFALNTAGSNIGYSSISMSGLDVTAIVAGTNQSLFANAQKDAPKPVGFINLAPLGTQANAYTLKIKFTAADGSTFEQTYNIGANTSAADVTALVLESIPQASVRPGGPGEPAIYGSGWNVRPNATGTGFFIYSHRATTQQKWVPDPVSLYSNASASAQGATQQPSVSESPKGSP